MILKFKSTSTKKREQNLLKKKERELKERQLSKVIMLAKEVLKR